MEVYVLDSLLRRTEVVDKFESLIWTERFSEVGDFELDLISTLENRRMFTHGTRLAINESYRVMKVETVEDTTSDDGKTILKIKGYSIEDILRHRVAKYSMSDTTTEPTWDLTGTPGDIGRAMFDHICRDGALDLKDKIPFLQPGTIFASSTIPEPTTPITVNQTPEDLYTALKNILDPYELGFRLVRDFDTSKLYFDIYAGNDRTSRQTVLAPVIFSPLLDNIQNTTELTTVADSKNVAYVFSPAGFKVVYGDNVDPDSDGFERRVLVINASDITADNVDVDGALIQHGIDELNKHRGQSLFDGEINQYNEYKYGVDYELGDLVEMRNKDGVVTWKRVTEQIFVSDDQGDRSYPTLYADIFAGENDWLSWNNKPTTWMDYDYFAYVYCGWENGTSDLTKLPVGVTLSLLQGARFTWINNTTDKRALLGPDGLTRNANTWYDSVSIHAQFTFTEAWSGILRLYAVDWDSVNRRETVTVTDATGAHSQSVVDSFHDGVWLSFPVQVNAGGTLDIVVHNDTGGTNAVLAEIFLDDGSESSTWGSLTT